MNEHHPFAAGFLSEAVQEVRADVHRTYPTHVAAFKEANLAAVAFQHSLEFRRDEPADLYGGALYARTLASVQASVVLLERGLVPQARTVLRSALETLFALCAIAKEPSLARPLLDSHNADRRRLADHMQRWQDPGLKAAIAAEVGSPEFAAALQSKSRELNHFDLAKRADMEDWYLSMYTLLSFSAHGAISDLSSHLVEDDSGELRELQNEPQVTGQSETWLYALEVLLRAVAAVAQLRAVEAPKLEHIQTQLRSLAANAA
jgi:Family of unknown function (DUF5677)